MDRIAQIRLFLVDQPEDAFLQHALALELIKIGEEQEARQLFENILFKQPEYVGSYYHLGKLEERAGAVQKAVQWYEQGMKYARSAGDQHAYNELQAAYDDLMD